MSMKSSCSSNSSRMYVSVIIDTHSEVAVNEKNLGASCVGLKMKGNGKGVSF